MSYRLQPDQIVQNAQIEICKRIPEMVEQNEATIIGAIVTKLSDILQQNYEKILDKGLENIKTSFSNDFTPKFIDTIKKITEATTQNALTETLSNLKQGGVSGGKHKQTHRSKSKKGRKYKSKRTKKRR